MSNWRSKQKQVIICRFSGKHLHIRRTFLCSEYFLLLQESSWLSWLYEKVVIVMIVYFVVSIINSMAHSYHKRRTRLFTSAAVTNKPEKLFWIPELARLIFRSFFDNKIKKSRKRFLARNDKWKQMCIDCKKYFQIWNSMSHVKVGVQPNGLMPLYHKTLQF